MTAPSAGSASPTPQVPMSRISASGASNVGVSDSGPTSAESTALFAHLYAASKDAVLAVDSKGTITHFNPSALNLFRVKEELAIGDRLENFLVEAQREPFRGVLAKFFEKSEKKLARTSLELTAIRGDGSNIRCEAALSGFAFKDTTYVCVLFRDVTERRAAAQRLHEAQKTEVLDRVAGEVAHDVNNLLLGIQGYSELIRACDGKDERDRWLVEIERLVKRGGELMRELRALARTGPPTGDLKMGPVDLNACLRDIRQILTRTVSGKISIEPALADGLPMISANRNQLEQAFMNICLNARDAMPGGGVLHLQTETLTPGEPFLQTHPGMPKGKLVKVIFRDTGAGMDAEILRRVFEPFFTTKEKQGCTGLGLPMAYKIVKQHGGYIWIDSAPGKGTAVEAYFPVLASDARAPEAGSSDRVVAGSGTLLVIEDEEPVLDTTRRLLAGIGYTVIAAMNGDEGIRIFSERHAEVSLALIDMKMPGKNGLEVFQELKKIDPAVKAILTTGYAVRGDTDAMFRLGLRAYLLKPYTLAELSSKIHAVLQGPAAPTPPAGSAPPAPQVPMSRISASGAPSVGVSESGPTSAESVTAGFAADPWVKHLESEDDR